MEKVGGKVEEETAGAKGGGLEAVELEVAVLGVGKKVAAEKAGLKVAAVKAVDKAEGGMAEAVWVVVMVGVGAVAMGVGVVVVLVATMVAVNV